MLNILLIEDEEDIVLMIKGALEVFGFNVESASNGIEGIKKFGKGHFDLVIMDILMPGIDGNDVAQRVQIFDKKSTPVIGISGTPWLLEGKHFDAVLEKPFSIKTLVGIILDLSNEQG